MVSLTSRATAPQNVELSEGKWPRLVSEADFFAVQRILSNPARKTSRPGRFKHLLSNIARCDICGGFLSVTQRRVPEGEYQCTKGHIRVRQSELDEFAESIMLDYLASPEYEARLTGKGEAESAEIAEVRADLANRRGELEELRRAGEALQVSVLTVRRMEPALLARISELEAREAELATAVPAVLAEFTSGADIARVWAQMPMAARREVARLLLSPEWRGELRVTRRPAGRRTVSVPARDRVVMRREPSTIG